MDLRVHGIDPAVIRRAQQRAAAAGESLSSVVRRMVARYAEHGDIASRGGAARAAGMTSEQRADIARKAAAARWDREKG